MILPRFNARLFQQQLFSKQSCNRAHPRTQHTSNCIIDEDSQTPKLFEKETKGDVDYRAMGGHNAVTTIIS